MLLHNLKQASARAKDICREKERTKKNNEKWKLQKIMVDR